LSPDGSQLAYVGVGGLFVRRLDNLTPRLLVSGPAAHPGWSPDGAWVAYVANGTLRKVSVGGGASLNIADSVSRFAWGSRGTIVFAHNGLARAELWRVSADGGVAERFVHQARPVDYTYGTPVFLPDGDAFVVTSITARGDSAELAAYRMSDGAFRYLGRGGSPIYLAGLLFYLNGSGDALLAAPFDAKALRFTGAPVPVLQDFVRKLSSAELSLSTNGTMAYLPGTASRALAEVDRGGRERVLPFPPGLLSDPRYSPDGRRLALVVGQPPATDVWIYDLSSQTMSKLTSNGRNSSPAWSPDGRRIAWMIPSGVAPGVYWRATDASDAESPIVPGGLGVAFTPDGKYALTGKSSMQTLVAARLDSSRAQTQIIPTFGPPSPTVTHDGRWMAFVSQASGRPEVYVRQLFGPGGQYQISSGGASEPAWNPRGGELFYVGGGKLISATIALTPEPHVVRRDTLFSMAAYAAGSDRHYDVSSDGQRFVVAKSADRGSQPVIAVGWVDEVRARVRTKR